MYECLCDLTHDIVRKDLFSDPDIQSDSLMIRVACNGCALLGAINVVRLQCTVVGAPHGKASRVEPYHCLVILCQLISSRMRAEGLVCVACVGVYCSITAILNIEDVFGWVVEVFILGWK